MRADEPIIVQMRRYRLSELQNDLKARGMPEFAEKLKKKTGYDPVARKLRRNPGEVEAARRVRRAR